MRALEVARRAGLRVFFDAATGTVRTCPSNHCLVIFFDDDPQRDAVPPPVQWSGARGWPTIAPGRIGDVDVAMQRNWQAVRDVVAAHPDADGQTLAAEIAKALP